MNSSTNKDTEDVKGMERRVESVDYQSSVGQGQEQRPVELIQSNTSGGVLANAAASVASTLESAKRAISRK
ncbi:uncharacterized protein [Solanum lycopersicum]|uniref:Uncharacterized protein n=1 Tax=Solanum lycopersicum TaxID=4081 RepID=K4BD92_SOLLC|nr:uncharacterized protein LOC109119614 [Solanum lycopersicum]